MSVLQRTCLRTRLMQRTSTIVWVCWPPTHAGFMSSFYVQNLMAQEFQECNQEDGKYVKMDDCLNLLSCSVGFGNLIFLFFVVLLFGPQIERSLPKEQLLVSKVMCYSAKMANCFYVAEPDLAELHKARCSLELALGLSKAPAKKRWSTGLNNDDLSWRPTKRVKKTSAIV